VITEKWIYRIFYGSLVAAVVFGMVWETIKTGKMPSVPFNTVLLLAVLTGTDAVLTFLKTPKQ
jgi:hypothetical protein